MGQKNKISGHAAVSAQDWRIGVVEIKFTGWCRYKHIEDLAAALCNSPWRTKRLFHIVNNTNTIPGTCEVVYYVQRGTQHQTVPEHSGTVYQRQIGADAKQSYAKRNRKINCTLQAVAVVAAGTTRATINTSQTPNSVSTRVAGNAHHRTKFK